MDRIVVLTGILIIGSQASFAYPPAPHHLIFGTVRDELGNPLHLGSADRNTYPATDVRTLRVGVSSEAAPPEIRFFKLMVQ